MLGKVIRGAMMIFVMSIIGSALGYLFRIILARNLSVAEYGFFYAIYSFFTVLILFVDLGLTQAVTKHVIDLNAKKRFSKGKGIIMGVLFTQLVISLIVFMVVFVFSKDISSSLFKTSDPLPLIMMGVWFLTVPLVNFLSHVFTGIKRMEVTSSLELFRQAVSLLLSLLFLYLNFGVQSPFLAYLCINVLMVLVYAPIIKLIYPEFTKIKTEYDKKVLLSVIKYSAYLIFSALISTVIHQTDTLLLTVMKGTEAVGLYQIAMPLALLITYFSGTVLTVAYPYVTELYTLKQHDKMRHGLSLLFKYTLVVSLPIAIVLFSYSELIISILFDPKYLAAAGTLRVLAVCTIFSTLVSMNNTILLATGSPEELSKNMLIAAIVNLLLNIALIPNFSIMGSAWASFISFLIAFFISCYKLKTKLQFKFPMITLILMLALGTGIFFLIQWLSGWLSLNQWVEIGIVGLITGAIYVGVLFLVRILDAKEITEFIRVTLKQR